MTPLALAVTGRGLVDPAEPVLRADDEALTRGRGVFETTRVYDGRPFRLDRHLARLAGSAERVGLAVPDAEELTRLTTLVIDAAPVRDLALRLYWTPGPPEGPPLGLALVGPIPDAYEPMRERGSRLVALTSPRRDVPWLLPGTKSTSYAVNMAAEAEAKRRGADDAIFVDADGVVLEGTVTNVWWRHENVLRTPSLELGILAGVTREALLELAPQLGFAVEEGVYRVADLLGSDEVFTSSSVREVMPVVELDGTRFERGDAAARLQAGLRRLASA
ncbi:MAG TPA: aminotransferase class IV [Gaiellaceae bacterium]|nr:aminotransferase class IV [Gaiellaceae bacterium]